MAALRIVLLLWALVCVEQDVEGLQQANAALAATNDALTAKYADLRDMTAGLLTPRASA